MTLYSIPVYECPDCIKQFCDGILFFDKDAVIVLHVSKSKDISLFEFNDYRIFVNSIQFETNWGWDFSRVHVSNYLYAKTKFDITYVIFLTSNCLILRNPSEFILNYDAGFSEQQYGIVKLTPPLLIQDYQIGWGGSFLTDTRYLSILSELNSSNKYGCIIDGTFVKSFIMDKICYFYEKYFNYENNYFCLEERLFPTIACNLTDKISDSLLYLRSVDLREFKELLKKEDVFFNKRIPLDMSNDIRIYYSNLINNK